jgi:hypothetical protein
MSSESKWDSIDAKTLLQFNATIVVGIFLFLTIGVDYLIVRLLILTTMFAFVASCTLILVKSESIGESDGRVRYVVSHFNKSKILSACGTIYLIGMLVFVFFILGVG